MYPGCNRLAGLLVICLIACPGIIFAEEEEDWTPPNLELKVCGTNDWPGRVIAINNFDDKIKKGTLISSIGYAPHVPSKIKRIINNGQIPLYKLFQGLFRGFNLFCLLLDVIPIHTHYIGNGDRS